MKSPSAPVEPNVEHDVDVVLTWHQGDAREAIATLLQDRGHLRKQLHFTEASMSTGFTRGWRPSYDRD